MGFSFPVRFDIPSPIKVNGHYLFKPENLPGHAFGREKLRHNAYAIGYTAHRDYFTYPNHWEKEKRMNSHEFREVMFRNAWLFGKLTSLGIVHSAPVPLFHNRVQGQRRADNGFYEWQRAGRLDRWLDSCSYPNFGLTGIRDFEHFIPFKGINRKLYRHIGNHLLGLMLVTGSYFRNKDRERIGFDKNGRVIDARDLFERDFFKELLEGIFSRYYQGFVGAEFSGALPFDFDALAKRMIEEMGVDSHMEEILRVVDQREMTHGAFTKYLSEKGYSLEEAMTFQKGIEDIVVHTGPHLGGFNRRISLPECIEALGSMSSLCVFGRHWRERFPEQRIPYVWDM